MGRSLEVEVAPTCISSGYCRNTLPDVFGALEDKVVAIVDCPVDYSENMKLTERLKNLKSPV